MDSLSDSDTPGVTFRPYAGAVDLPAVVAVMEDCWRADGVEMTLSLETAARLFASRLAFDPTRQALLALDGERVIGVGRHLHERLRDGTEIYSHSYAVHPDWRGRGVERALLRWNESRLRAMAASAPLVATGSHLFAWLGPVHTSETALIADLAAQGYAPIHQDLVMFRPTLEDPPEATLPSGFDERPITPEQFPALYAAYKEFFADAFHPTPPSEEDYQRWTRRRCFRDLSLGHVVWSGDRVAGMALCAIDAEENRRYRRLRGLVEHVGVVPEYRGHGVARALLSRALMALRERGMREASLLVDARNRYGAIHLYEWAGFAAVDSVFTYARPLELEQA